MSAALFEEAARLVGHRVGPDNQAHYERALVKAAHALHLSREEALALAKSNKGSAAYRQLVSSMTVNETYFFRHPEHFELLDQQARLAHQAGRPYRTAWSVGCASGEETYSIAMVLAPYDEAVRVGGSDASPEALERARAGRYGGWSFRARTSESIPGMIRSGDRSEVPSWLRERVFFREANLVDAAISPPAPLPAQVDVVFCRNVLLYLDPALAERAVRALASAVREGGLLLLGCLDEPDCLPDGFERLADQRCCALRRLPARSGAVAAGYNRPVPTAPAIPVEVGVTPKPSLPPPAPAPELVKARQFANEGNFIGALRCLSSLGDDQPEALLLRASIQLEQGRSTSAELLLRRALMLAPDSIPAHLQLALLGARRGDTVDVARHRGAIERLLLSRDDGEELGFDGVTAGDVRQVLIGLEAKSVTSRG